MQHNPFDTDGFRSSRDNPQQSSASTRLYRKLRKKYESLHPEDVMFQGLINQHVKFLKDSKPIVWDIDNNIIPLSERG